MNSELAGILGSLLIGAVTWLYHKAKGDKADSVSTLVDGLVGQAIHLAVTSADQDPAAVRAIATDYVWRGLVLAKVPRSATTELVVNAGIELAISEALAALRAHDRAVAVAIAANVASAQADTAKALELQAAHKKAMAEIAKIQPPDDVTILAPDPDAQFTPGFAK